MIFHFKFYFLRELKSFAPLFFLVSLATFFRLFMYFVLTRLPHLMYLCTCWWSWLRLQFVFQDFDWSTETYLVFSSLNVIAQVLISVSVCRLFDTSLFRFFADQSRSMNDFLRLTWKSQNLGLWCLSLVNKSKTDCDNTECIWLLMIWRFKNLFIFLASPFVCYLTTFLRFPFNFKSSRNVKRNHFKLQLTWKVQIH